MRSNAVGWNRNHWNHILLYNLVNSLELVPCGSCLDLIARRSCCLWVSLIEGFIAGTSLVDPFLSHCRPLCLEASFFVDSSCASNRSLLLFLSVFLFQCASLWDRQQYGLRITHSLPSTRYDLLGITHMVPPSPYFRSCKMRDKAANLTMPNECVGSQYRDNMWAIHIRNPVARLHISTAPLLDVRCFCLTESVRIAGNASLAFNYTSSIWTVQIDSNRF